MKKYLAIKALLLWYGLINTPLQEQIINPNQERSGLAQGNLQLVTHNAQLLHQRVRQIYLAELGTKEATDHNDGPAVEKYLSYTGLGKGYAWCAAFVCWVYGQAGVKNPRTAWAASLFPKSKLVWQQLHLSLPSAVTISSSARVRRLVTHNAQLVTVPMASVFGIYFPSLKRIGHCGFIDQWGEKEVITVEGNTNANGGREGDGVCRKRRPVKSIDAVADWIGKGGEQ